MRQDDEFCRSDIPRSLMLKTPGTLELFLLGACFSSLGGDDERPCTAESTLVSGSDMIADDQIGLPYVDDSYTGKQGGNIGWCRVRHGCRG